MRDPTNAVQVERDVKVTMADGAVLLADVHHPVGVEDFFGRLCDVHPDGRSVNVCDGLRRCDPSSIRRGRDGAFHLSVPMWPGGHRLAAGHRLRVQVSSGAHPVYARNLGTGEAVATATTMRAADQAVHREPGRLSSVTLPHVRD
jgi:predicted acyl esterase